MDFYINEETYRASFFDSKGKFSHKSNNRIVLFPYVTNGQNLKEVSFENVVGSFFREIYGLKVKSELEEEALIRSIIDHMKYNGRHSNKEVMQDVLNRLYFSGGKLKQFDIKSYEQLPESGREPVIAGLMAHTMAAGEDIKASVRKSEQREIHVLDRMVLESLPELSRAGGDTARYYNECPEFRELFTQDLCCLIEKDISDVDSIVELFRFYYFTYISRTILRLNQKFQDPDPEQEKLYYCVSWERTGRNRRCYKEGWRKLERVAQDMLAHSVLLEILNQNDRDVCYDYRDIRNMLEASDDEERAEIYAAVCRIENDYVNEYFPDYTFRPSEVHETREHDVIRHIENLFDRIREQFMDRLKAPNGRFVKGYTEFAKRTFLRNRLSMGYMLELSEKLLLLLTKLAIGEEEQISLAKLFHTFEEKGVYTDHTTRDHIVEYFEKLNIIEKKSDSGDAQYVRRFL